MVAAMTEPTNDGRSRSARARNPRGHSTADKMTAVGLSVAACAGLVGVVAFRSEQAAQQKSAQQDTVDATTAAYKQQAASLETQQAELIKVANQLLKERKSLDTYRTQLTKASKSLAQQQVALQAAANASGGSGGASSGGGTVYRTVNVPGGGGGSTVTVIKRVAAPPASSGGGGGTTTTKAS
jgi:hypothetical protein